MLFEITDCKVRTNGLGSSPRGKVVYLSGLCIQVPEPMVIGLHPEVLVLVNIQTLDGTLDTPFVQPLLSMTIARFCHWIKDGVLYTMP